MGLSTSTSTFIVDFYVSFASSIRVYELGLVPIPLYFALTLLPAFRRFNSDDIRFEVQLNQIIAGSSIWLTFSQQGPIQV
jgi:hypothetical protein